MLLSEHLFFSRSTFTSKREKIMASFAPLSTSQLHLSGKLKPVIHLIICYTCTFDFCFQKIVNKKIRNTRVGSKFGWKKLGRRINYMSSLTMARLGSQKISSLTLSHPKNLARRINDMSLTMAMLWGPRRSRPRRAGSQVRRRRPCRTGCCSTIDQPWINRNN